MKTEWEKEAAFSACGRYRWWLSRTRKVGSGTVVFIGLNPSTADGKKDDPTCKRMMGFTEAWGFRRMVIVNTNPCVSTDPRGAELPAESTLAMNDSYLRSYFIGAELIVYAWGTHVVPELAERVMRVPTLGLTPISCFGRNKNGTPKHPLYLPKNCQLQYIV